MKKDISELALGGVPLSISHDFLFIRDDISYAFSPNIGGEFLADRPDTIIMHYTAGGSVESAVSHLIDPENEVSAHLVVGRGGEVVQMVPFNRIAWHAGKSQWGGRVSLNQYSIGIEIVNAGYLDPVSEGFQSWFGQRYPESEVLKFEDEHGVTYWHKYTESQLDKVFELTKVLCSTFNIKNILGHSQISPGRKVDPGPAFPMERFLKIIKT